MRTPRLLPLVGVAAAGVLAVKALASVEAIPAALEGARAWAEDAAGPAKGSAGKAANAKPPTLAAASLPPARPPAPVCAPTAAELAKEAGLSPAELQTLQSLGARRGQLDDREKAMETQLALLAAAEGKLDGKIAALNALKGDIRGLMVQADQQKAAEVDRLVIVYQAMKPKDAAARMTLLDDDVRLPIAAKMKERALSAILAQMAPVDAKALTEKLAAKFDPKLAAARAALAPNQASAAGAAPIGTAAAKPAPARAPAAKPTQLASADPLAPAPATKPSPHKPAKPRARAARPAPKPTALAANTPARPASSPAAAPAKPGPAAAVAPKPVAPARTAAAPAPATAKPTATAAAAPTATHAPAPAPARAGG